MPDEIKGDIRHLQDKVTQVEVTVGHISHKVDHTAVEIAEMRMDLKHETRGRASLNQVLVKLDTQLGFFAEKLADLEENKADRKDVEFQIKLLTDDLKEIKEARAKMIDLIRKIAVPLVIAIIGGIGTYFAKYLGLDQIAELISKFL